MRTSLPLRLLSTLCLFCFLAIAQTANYDVILRNGMIIDGTGAKGYRGDVGVRGGFIYKIGDLRGAKAAVDLDVKGLIVAPGFINLHSHATREGVPTAVNMLTQGVTTEIINADGAGATAIAKQVTDFSAAGLAVNIGAYAPFNSIWATVTGNNDRRPTVDDINKMRELLTENLKQGAWGVAAGLDYKPAYFARTEEVISVMKAASNWRTNFPNHDRLTPESKYSSLVAIGETIAIGETTNVMPVITHMKVQGREQGSAAMAVALMRDASARGHETVADIYPYLAGQTGLGALFVPAWAVVGGRDEMLKRFRDSEMRTRIAREIEEAIAARVLSPENIDIFAKKRKLSDFMTEYNAGAGETLMRILEKEHPSAIMKFGAEADLVALLQYPGSSVSCDCGAIKGDAAAHPRYFGTFPRVLGHYVRETKSLTLEDAVRKMSGLPTSIIGMVDRGFLAPGMAADITVFDPATVADHATYEQPALASDGIRHVLVNGKIALRDGKATGVANGKVMTRLANMPSRPMRVTGEASIAGKTQDVAIDVKRGADGKSRGGFHFVDAATATEVRVAEFGLLQTSAKWASFTGIAKVGTENKAVMIVVDGANATSAKPTVWVEVEGGRRFEVTAGESDFKIGAK